MGSGCSRTSHGALMRSRAEGVVVVGHRVLVAREWCSIVSHGRPLRLVGAMGQDVTVSEWVVVMRFRVPPTASSGFRDEAATVARLLAEPPGCAGVQVARASDDPSLWAMVARWQSVGSYRKALSSYEVKADAVPFLVAGDRRTDGLRGALRRGRRR